jgi:hypothetical protein
LVSGLRDLTDESLVLFVRSDPIPQNTGGRIDAERAVARADSHRPISAYSLEVKRRMLGIGSQQLIVVTRELLEFG